MNTVHIDHIREGMTVATIPSRDNGMRTRIVGAVLHVERYELGAGRAFADLRLDSGTTVTNMSGVYELVADPAAAEDDTRCAACGRLWSSVLAEGPAASDEWTFHHGPRMEVVAETCSDRCADTYESRAA